MKVNCPECSTHFDIPVSALGTGGRRVRCNNCNHVWFAEPANDDDTSFNSFRRFNEDMDIEPIPSSVHPAGDDEMGHGQDGGSILSGIDKKYALRLVGGFALACTVVGMLLGIGAALGLNAGPLRSLYAPLGLASNEPVAHPLVIGDVKAVDGADSAGQPAVNITGTITNTTDKKVDLPILEITILSEMGVAGDSIQVKGDQKSLEPAEIVNFSAAIPGVGDPKGQVRLRFLEH